LLDAGLIGEGVDAVEHIAVEDVFFGSGEEFDMRIALGDGGAGGPVEAARDEALVEGEGDGLEVVGAWPELDDVVVGPGGGADAVDVVVDGVEGGDGERDGEERELLPDDAEEGHEWPARDAAPGAGADDADGAKVAATFRADEGGEAGDGVTAMTARGEVAL